MDTPLPTLTPTDLQRFMDAHRIAGELVFCEAPTPTVEAAAQVMGVHPDQIVKSILFLISDRPLLVIACGTRFVDRKALSDRFGVGRKQVKLADAAAVLEISGYPAGTVPPFGHRAPIPTLLDRRVLAQPVVYAGGGGENVLLRLETQTLLNAAQAEVVDTAEAPA